MSKKHGAAWIRSTKYFSQTLARPRGSIAIEIDGLRFQNCSSGLLIS